MTHSLEAPAAPQPGDSARSSALPWLVADIGGTNARFGWVSDPSEGVTHVRTLETSRFPGPAQAAAAYLAEVGPLVQNQRISRSAWAVATAIEGDMVALTNGAWRFSRSELMQSLGVERLLILNDFEALALSLPRLSAQQVRTQGVLPRARGVLAAIGPGTGLGVGGVVQTAHGWVALPGEGGHATLAPADDFESELLTHVRRTHAHVSAERLLSGIGLPVLHGAVAAVLGLDAAALDAKAIVERGTTGADATCARTLETFCALLGGFAGNVALTLGAQGVYIGGGIVPRLGDRFFESLFRTRFEAKGRFAAYLAAVPTAVITDTLAALSGAALALEQDGR